MALFLEFLDHTNSYFCAYGFFGIITVKNIFRRFDRSSIVEFECIGKGPIFGENV